VRAIGNMLGDTLKSWGTSSKPIENLLITQWKLHENFIRTKTIPTPTPYPKQIKPKSMGAFSSTLLSIRILFCLHVVFDIFGLG
jgi:hypothetical protein